MPLTEHVSNEEGLKRGQGVHLTFTKIQLKFLEQIRKKDGLEN